jgi:hypothetical protein
MSHNAVLSCLDQRQARSTVQLNPCMSFLTARGSNPWLKRNDSGLRTELSRISSESDATCSGQ